MPVPEGKITTSDVWKKPVEEVVQDAPVEEVKEEK